MGILSLHFGEKKMAGIQRLVFNGIKHNFKMIRNHRSFLCTTCRYSKNTQSEFTEEPLQYSKSKAHDWKSYESFTPPRKDYPWYQTYVIVGSVSAFLIYFCVLREENDIDETLSVSLFERIPGLEEKQLRLRIQYDQEAGKDVSELVKRLQEL